MLTHHSSEQFARHLLKLQLRRSVSVLTWVRELWLCSAPWLLTGFCSQQGKGWPAYLTAHRRGTTPAPRNTKTQSARQPHPRRSPQKHPTQQTHDIYTYEMLPRLIPHDPVCEHPRRARTPPSRTQQTHSHLEQTGLWPLKLHGALFKRPGQKGQADLGAQLAGSHSCSRSATGWKREKKALCPVQRKPASYREAVASWGAVIPNHAAVTLEETRPGLSRETPASAVRLCLKVSQPQQLRSIWEVGNRMTSVLIMHVLEQRHRNSGGSGRRLVALSGYQAGASHCSGVT